MDTIVRPPTTAPPQPTPPRRGVRRLVVAAIAIVTGVIVFSGLYLWRYQPLSANGTGAYWADPEFATSLGYFTSPQGEDFSAYRVRYRDGELFRSALTLRNEGPLAVTVTGVGDLGCAGCEDLLVFHRASIGPATGQFVYDVEHVQPFEPFVLEPGTFRLVLIERRFDHCESFSPGSGSTFTHVPVDYRVGPVDRSVLLPMPFTLELQIGQADCR